jgi:hypothetical protein
MNILQVVLLLLSSALLTSSLCPSGQDGYPCAAVDTGSCSFPNASSLATTAIAELMTNQTSFQNNSLSFLIDSPATQGRIITSIVFNDAVNSNCTYPGSSFSRGFDTSACADTFLGSFSFPQIINCGFSIPSEYSSNSTYYIYEGTVSVSGTDPLPNLGSISIQRTTSSSLNVFVLLPKSVEVTSSNITVFSAISLQAAVTLQQFDVLSQTATIQITTDVPYPYRFTSSNVLSLPSQISSGSVSSVNVTDSSCSTPDSDCLQVVSFTISTDGICSFTGNYSISLTAGCESSFSPCPVTSASNENITFSLTSGDICATLVVNSALGGQISSYFDDAFSQASLLFIAGETGYFKASITSGVTIQTLSLVNLNVLYPTQVPLRNSSVNTLLGNLANLTTTGFTYSPSANELVFAFDMTVGSDPSSNIFSNAGNINQVFTFTVVADIDVTYKTSFGKRDVKTDTLKLSQKFVIDMSNVLKQQQQQQKQELISSDLSSVSSSSSSGSSVFYGSLVSMAFAFGSLLLL